MTTNLLGAAPPLTYITVEPKPSPAAGKQTPTRDGIGTALAGHTIVDTETFQQVVDSTYESLYRFAFSLTHREADACDLTQETFRRYAERGHQLRDPSKVKTWLFTTLYRRYITLWRKENRFPHFELNAVGQELPGTPPPNGAGIDAASAREALAKLPELHRVPLLLFYLEDHTYAEIAEILGIPSGTVMSRISRGRQELRKHLADAKTTPTPTDS